MGKALSRRALFLSGAAVTGCALPWQPVDPRAPIITPPAQTPVRFGPIHLRLVLAAEGHAPLDAAVRAAITRVGRELGYELDFLDLESFVGTGTQLDASSIARRLLITVQAGLPPTGLLLLGRQVQTPRLQAMGLIQEVSGLLRTARTRWGQAPEVAERGHVVGGGWFVAPLYQRMIGHWARANAFARAGLDPETATATFPDLSAALSRPGLGGQWGVGPEDTADADAWCWSAIHGWGGGLTERTGQRITVAAPESRAALEWLAATFRDARVAPPEQRPAAFEAGDVPYLYTEGPPPAGGTLLTGPAGPIYRPRMVGGGAVWLLPRGAPPDPCERLWEALFQPASQRELWAAGGGFALPYFESHWSDPGVGALPAQENVRRFHTLLGTGGYVSDSGQLGKPSEASQAVESGRLAVRMVRALLAGRPIDDVLTAGRADTEAIYKEHAFPG